ncbi:MAG TPA: class I SAM-dependent methyltransferase [Gemmatimonadaceae bacterium]
MAACPAVGANVEIGSFKGRSTIGLAHIAIKLGLGAVTAIDPHTAPASTDPDLKGALSSYDDFVRNVATAGVASTVDARRAFSQDVAKDWCEPIRFLWIDGDHTYEGALRDVEMFKPFLVDGAVVAMHDVLGTFEGSLRVFIEEILDCDSFGPAGFSGSIGWAQYRPRDGAERKFRLRRKLLSIPARRLLPVAVSGGLVGWNKYAYKFWRPLAPHGDVKVSKLQKLFH